VNMGGMNYTIPTEYFARQRREREETEIPNMRRSESREWSGPAAATGANAAVCTKRMKIGPPL
jgi:hypothetical protein